MNEEEIREVIDHGVYYFYSFWHPDINHEIEKFKTSGSPLEYLVFNEKEFTFNLLYSLPTFRRRVQLRIREHEQYDDDYDLDDNFYNLIPKYPELIWEEFQKMTAQEFLAELCETRKKKIGVYVFILDKDLKPIIPVTNSKRVPEIEGILKRWGLQ